MTTNVVIIVTTTVVFVCPGYLWTRQVMKKLFSLSFVAFTALGSAIIFRHDVDPKPYRELAKQPQFACAGRVFMQKAFAGSCVLIAPNKVLTAAHVIDEQVTDPNWKTKFTVRFGDKSARVISFKMKPKVAPPPADSIAIMPDADIAVLTLDKPISGIEPAKVYTGKSEIGKVTTIVGAGYFGKATDAAMKPTEVFYAGHNMVDEAGSNKEMDAQIGGGGPAGKVKLFIPDWTLSSDFDGKGKKNMSTMGSTEPLPLECGTEGGDSGCPWFIQEKGVWYLVGIMSFGEVQFQSGRYGSTSRAIRVSKFADWIRKS